MQRCCILGCETYKYADSSLMYFKFPFHNDLLLEQWLIQIGRRDWHPAKDDVICSVHFKSENIEIVSEMCPRLKTMAMPTIFPPDETPLLSNCTATGFSAEPEETSLLSDCMEPSLNAEHMIDLTFQTYRNERITKLPQKELPTQINESSNGNPNATVITPVSQTRLRKILPKPDGKILQRINYSNLNCNKTANLIPNITIPTLDNSNEDTMDKLSNVTMTTKIPVLKITINKKYNVPCTLTSEQYENQCTPDIVTPVDAANQTDDTLLALDPNLEEIPNLTNFVVTPEPVILNFVPIANEKPVKRKNTVIQTKNDISIPKTAFARRGDLSRDNSRNQTIAERLRYLYTKAQRDCDVLRIRLKALRERHKQEQDEIKKLQKHLGATGKNIKEKPCNPASAVHTKRKKKCNTPEGTDNEDEYEKLLREVRKMKQDMLNQKHPVTVPNKKFEKSVTTSLHSDEKQVETIENESTRNNNFPNANGVDRGEIVGEVNDNLNSSVEVIYEQLATNFQSDNEDTVLYVEEEYLDQVFTDV